jgi:hypothetical protein
VNVHAKSCLTPEPLRTLRSETKGPGRSLPGPDAGHPLQGAGISHRGEESRAISVQLDRVTSGQSGAVEVCEVGWSTGITGYDLSDSQADNPVRSR